MIMKEQRWLPMVTVTEFWIVFESFDYIHSSFCRSSFFHSHANLASPTLLPPGQFVLLNSFWMSGHLLKYGGVISRYTVTTLRVCMCSIPTMFRQHWFLLSLTVSLHFLFHTVCTESRHLHIRIPWFLSFSFVSSLSPSLVWVS